MSYTHKNNNQIANSDDLDNYERNTEETIKTTTLSQEGINECTAEQESPGIPINVPTEDEQFYVDIRNIAQPTFNLLKESVGNWDNRDSSTFTKKIPNARQIKVLERIAESIGLFQSPSALVRVCFKQRLWLIVST